MKKHFKLQLFADGAESTDANETVPGTAEKGNSAEAAADRETEKNAPEKKYTDEEVDKLLNRKFAEWEKKKQKAVDEAAKLAGMNEQQRAEHERDELKKQLAELKQEKTLSEMTKTARKMLTDEGIPASDEILAVLVTPDAEKTKTAISAYTKAYHADVEKGVKERLKGETPRKGSGGVPVMTKEQIMSIRDPELRQKKMLENKTLFNF